MLRGMENAILGVWTSHGEGKFAFRSPIVLDNLEKRGLVAIRYVNSEGSPTQKYPANPNGSPNAIAGICSDDGRHFCLM